MKRASTILLSVLFAVTAVGQPAPPSQAAPPAQQAPRRREVTPEGRQKIEAALPSKAPAKPRRPRKLLVVDYRGGHPSVPYANLAVELMGFRTGAYEAVL